MTPSPVVAWIDAPRADEGIRFATADGWALCPYDEVAARARTAAVQIAGAPAESQDRAVVALVVRAGLEFVSAFYGTLLAGRTPCPIVPPGSFQGLDDYREHLIRLLEVCRPGLIVTDDELVDFVGQAAGRAGMTHRPLVLSPGARDEGPVGAPPAELALLQFTSGSSGTPKGSRVTWANLEAGLAITGQSLQVESGSHYASWLPLYHDMGLIGGLLLPVSRQCALSHLRPDQFIREPLRYLACLGRDGATNTATPPFGLAYAAKRVRPEDLRGMDFSGWVSAGVGAERIGAAPLHRFAGLLAPHGFDPTTFAPGFGMAEATLQVTGSPWDAVPWAVRVESSSLRLGERVRCERRGLMEAGTQDGANDWLVSSGLALADFELCIEGADGATLAEGHLGELVIRGDAVVDGYEGGSPEQLAAFRGREFHTGDAAFLLDGELFLIGRMGDAISVRGRSIYLEDVEAKLEEVPGVPAGRCVVLADARRVVALVEADPGDWMGPVRAAIVRHCGTELTVEVRCAARGTIRRTSSGKPRRRWMWQRLVAGELDAETQP